ncbi:hypothetical protein ACLMJK_001499 [Lecanora helva]
MAKSLRSHRNKTNKAKLRSSVFGPNEDARKGRLSAKLLELASKPKPKPTLKKEGNEGIGVDVDKVAHMLETSKHDQVEQEDKILSDENAMDLDHVIATSAATHTKSRSAKRLPKKGRTKAAASMVFPIYKKGRRIGPRLGARQRKQSLRP